MTSWRGAGGGTRAADAKQLFIDVHELSPGSVTPEAVAAAHAKDLAVQGAHGVEFEKYWVDEEAGLIYCLSHAPDAASVVSTHREAHGLLPTTVLPVNEGQAARLRNEGGLFLDIHRLGAGHVTAKAVAEAHAKDLAVQGAHGVNFVQYWVDETDGVVVCLSEAPDSEAVRATHREAHGLLPDRVLEVIQGE
jgi:phenolic acid decarboxylase